MSLEKAILHKKERRRPYRGAKAVDKSCRNHGDCRYCMAARIYASTKRLASAKEKISEYQSERADFFMQKRGEVTDV